MENRSFVEIIREQLARDDQQIPMFHPIALKLQDTLKTGDYTIQQVIGLISKDQALTSQILRMANSAFFSGLSKVATLKDAVVRLGTVQIANLAMLATQENSYSFTAPEFKAVSQSLWKHSMGCAMGSRWLARKSGYQELEQEAFLCGLLHDIGKLFILKVLATIPRDDHPGPSFSRELLLELMDCIHCEAGHTLMQKWNLPNVYCDVARDHHQEQSDPGNTLLAVVRLVDTTCLKMGLGLRHDPAIVLTDCADAQTFGLKDIVFAELEIMIEDSMGITSQ
jgi:HD-like signal output (HDOD) protein